MSTAKRKLNSGVDEPLHKKTKSASTVGDKIVQAIRALKNVNGSSLPAISKHIRTELNYDNLTAIKKSLKKGVEDGLLTKNKASYLVSGDPIYEDISEKVETHDIKKGEGAEVGPSSTCTISYKGTLEETGVQFDAGKNFTFTLGAGEVIKGMESIKGMCVGGRRKLIIPSSLGYGARGSAPDIPPHAVLCFDITLKSLS